MKSLRVIAATAGLLLSFGVAGCMGGTAAPEPESGKALVRRGARLWSPYCGACHNARPPSERSPTEWETIALHMRVRANLSARDTEALLAFLKSR